MPRPQVDTDRRDRLEELVDKDTQLPASALTFDEQLDYLLEQYEGYKITNDRLGDRVDELQRKLETEREDDTRSSGRPETLR